ncbi:MAG: serine/threonine-protein phosphatase, partial [Leifsonia sp.]|nr:serine/threonine-protein phosphatase [Leifsonia sp.]
RRRLTWLIGFIALVIAIVLAIFFGYQWTQSRYYVGMSPQGHVAIYQGVQQCIGPIGLSHLYQDSDVKVDDLPAYDKQQVEQTINADNLQAAKTIVEQLSDAGRQ